jgi:hypothetical protein
MCDRKNRLEGGMGDSVTFWVADLWPLLLSRHNTCQPSEACVIDVCMKLSEDRENA